MVDNKNYWWIQLTIEKKINHEIAYIRQAHKSSRFLLLHQFLKLGKFVWRDYLHSMIQQVTGSLLRRSDLPCQKNGIKFPIERPLAIIKRPGFNYKNHDIPPYAGVTVFTSNDVLLSSGISRYCLSLWDLVVDRKLCPCVWLGTNK